MGFAPSVASLGAERLANHGMELRTPLITTPPGRYQGAPALIPAVSHTGKHRTMNEDAQVREVYAHFGLPVYMAQVLEHALVNAMVVARLPQRARVTGSEIDDFMSEQFDAMLGKLI